VRDIRALIVDDEPVARTGLRKLLADTPGMTVVGEAVDGPTAVAAIRRLRPDLVLLDIQMPGMSGFEVLQAVGPRTVPAVVFVTAYDQFAVRAFEIQALDYLLKPFEDERFAAVLERVRAHLRRRREGDLAHRLANLLEMYEARAGTPDVLLSRAHAPSATSAPGAYLSRIIVRTAGRVFFQPVEDIDWIEAADYYARLHVGPHAHLVRETLASLATQLDPAAFVRVHRSAIVNVARVVEVRLDWRNRHVVVLRGGERLPLSRRRKDELERVMLRPPAS
jgi:two-component system LytT family response regulator